MNTITRWLLKRICRKLVMQSHNHEANIIEYYEIMNIAARNEFHNDSSSGHARFLQECWLRSMGL